jgi:hypothetical protein
MRSFSMAMSMSASKRASERVRVLLADVAATDVIWMLPTVTFRAMETALEKTFPNCIVDAWVLLMPFKAWFRGIHRMARWGRRYESAIAENFITLGVRLHGLTTVKRNRGARSIKCQDH